MYIFGRIYTSEQYNKCEYIYIYATEKCKTKYIYIQKQQNEKKPYTRRFLAGPLSPGVADRLRDPGEGVGVAIRGERLGTVGSVTVSTGGGVGSATTDGVGVARRGERRRSSGFTAGERDRLRDCRCGPA